MTSRHLDAQQLPRTSAEPPPKGIISSRLWLVRLAALAIGIGAIGTWFSTQHGTDQVSQHEIAARATSLKLSAPLELDSIPPDKATATLEGMKLPLAERAQLQSALATATPGQGVRLASVTLWDTHAEDGDVVTISSAGYRLDVVITHAPQVVTFPIDGTSVVQITGRHDGGGGITLGVRGTHQELLMPIMSEGQTLALPVLAK